MMKTYLEKSLLVSICLFFRISERVNLCIDVWYLVKSFCKYVFMSISFQYVFTIGKNFCSFGRHLAETSKTSNQSRTRKMFCIQYAIMMKSFQMKFFSVKRIFRSNNSNYYYFILLLFLIKIRETDDFGVSFFFLHRRTACQCVLCV